MVDYFVAVECCIICVKTRYYKPYFEQPSSEKLINRPVILTLVCSELAY